MGQFREYLECCIYELKQILKNNYENLDWIGKKEQQNKDNFYNEIDNTNLMNMEIFKDYESLSSWAVHLKNYILNLEIMLEHVYDGEYNE